LILAIQSNSEINPGSKIDSGPEIDISGLEIIIGRSPEVTTATIDEQTKVMTVIDD
jgi:hypothetical protein